MRLSNSVGVLLAVAADVDEIAVRRRAHVRKIGRNALAVLSELAVVEGNLFEVLVA